VGIRNEGIGDWENRKDFEIWEFGDWEFGIWNFEQYMGPSAEEYASSFVPAAKGCGPAGLTFHIRQPIASKTFFSGSLPSKVN
jgi:hypothetical protein